MTENHQGTGAVFNVVNVDAVSGNDAGLKVRERAHKLPLPIIVVRLCCCFVSRLYENATTTAKYALTLFPLAVGSRVLGQRRYRR